jgi:zinc/manganese transport system substrate-binding protein
MPRSTALLLAAIALILAAVCAVALRPTAVDGPSRVGGRIEVVAAESAYGSIAAQIGGRHVSVVSLLADPGADPHLYEPGTQAAVEVAGAAVAVQNGLGYDPFMPRLEAAAPDPRRVVVTIADVLHVTAASANPHLWYDVPRAPAVAAAIAAALARADPAHRAQYAAGLARFDRSLAPLERAVRRLRAGHAGQSVAYTEPLPGYLLTAAGLRVRTPPEFARAVEEGTDPTPQSVSALLALIRRRAVRVLLVNDQTASQATDQVRSAALAAGVPVVAVSETLPPGLSYQRWQLASVRALGAALSR